ncbi:hypothetical protein V5799_033503, partial [Amblyomma americanum]
MSALTWRRPKTCETEAISAETARLYQGYKTWKLPSRHKVAMNYQECNVQITGSSNH